jgi:hypothetical protein
VGVQSVPLFSSPIYCFSGSRIAEASNQCSASFPAGQPVILVPTIAPAVAVFAGWNLPPAAAVPGCSGTNSCNFTLTADTTVTATFNPQSATKDVTVILGGLDLGVISTPAGISCSSVEGGKAALCSATFQTGTEINLFEGTPIERKDIAIAGWSGGPGDSCSAPGDCVFTLLADTEVTALVGPATPGGSIRAAAAAATLPTDRNVSLGGDQVLVANLGSNAAAAAAASTATIFGTLINTSSATATNCAVQPSPSANLPGPFVYQTTNPATNALTGTANTPVNIPAGQAQSFVLAFTPTLPFAPVDVPLIFSCANLLAAPSVSGLNTVLLAASATPVPDVIALGATTTNDQILHITGSTGSAAFAVASINLGAGDTITISADTGGSGIPVGITLCQTNPQSGQCLAAPSASVTTQINSNDTPTFGVFVMALDTVNFDPTDNRVFVSFFDSAGTQRGGTSVAVETQ